MKYLKRILYFVYYLKESDKKELNLYLKYASEKTGKNKLLIVYDLITSVFQYNISFKDYFCFRFFELDSQERNKFAGTGYMYQFQLQMNPKKSRIILENKIYFLQFFKSFIKRRFFTLSELKENRGLAEELINKKNDFIVLKGSTGQIGAEVEVLPCNSLTVSHLIKRMNKKRLDLLEEYVVQHPSLMELSPSGLNTIRIFTQIYEDKVDILGARLRITVNSKVDNMAAGNLAAPIDITTGIVNGPAVYSDITKKEVEKHPVTNKPIVGFKIPFWNEVIEMAIAASLHTPENKSVGWDIAVTKEGPELIEGNHNWCKLLWQLPIKKGMKKVLEKYK